MPHSPVDAPQWSLLWFAYEVVGADVIRLPGDGGVATTVGASPPSSFPVDEFARLLAAANGDVERVVIGAEARRVPLPARSVQ